MNLMTTVLQSTFCFRLTETLGHFLWQGTILALLTAGVAIALRRRSSHLRYGIFLAALLAMVACPLVTFTLFINWQRFTPYATAGYLIGVAVMLTRLLVPTVVGVFRPMVLLPLTLTTGLTTDQIEAFLFFHPAIWYVSRLVRAEREICCDDLVVATGGKATLYASSLLQIAELCLRFKSVSTIPNAAALGLTDRSSNLSRRILRLLGSTSHEQVRLVRGRNVAILIILIIGIALLFSVSTANSGETAPNSHDNSTTAGSVKISSSSEKNPAQFMIQATILSVPADTDLSLNIPPNYPRKSPPTIPSWSNSRPTTPSA